ncbi:hypothetical protein EYC58_01650 [Candidatus Saccharibacteria bacterium]|nr:MAG: hypothetical protein EYC58_01650 [Candidatus Saccharibacteria bacterium]
MSLTKDDIQQIGAIVVEVTTPMFEMLGGKIDNLEGRMGSLEGRMDSLENELRDFKAEVRTSLATLEEKIDRLEASHTNRFENVEDDVQMLYTLVNKLEHGTKEEKIFAEQTIVRHLPAIYKSVMIIAKKHNISLDT